MIPSSTSAPHRNATVQRQRKSTQRTRLVAAMIEVASRDGYARATVASVIAAAGVSRRTFYDYFQDRHDCYLATVAEIQKLLLARVRDAVSEQAPGEATQATIAALLDFTGAEPEMARVLMGELTAAGPRALQVRKAGIVALAQVVERARGRLSPADPSPDISTQMTIGGVQRLIAAGLRRGQPSPALLREPLTEWVERYAYATGEHRWRTLTPLDSAEGARAATPEESLLREPAPLPPGRSRLSREEVSEHQRKRILLATARAAEQKGYGAMTVADISKLARVDARTFYRHFSDRQAAFTALHELHFQHAMAITAAAFFSVQDWPERIWHASVAFGRYMDANPLLAHASLVEGNAGGPNTVQRGEDLVGAFTIFLQEGRQQAPAGATPSRLELAAIAAVNFETAYNTAREGRPLMTALVPHSVFLSLCPFLGVERTNRLIDSMLDRAS